MEELDALLGSIPAAKTTESTTTGASKAEAQPTASGEGKKKKKKKNKAAGEGAEEKKEEKPAATEATELTQEQKEAAIREALKKRAGGQAQKGKDAVLLTAKIEKAERKQKAKKSKGDDYDR